MATYSFGGFTFWKGGDWPGDWEDPCAPNLELYPAPAGRAELWDLVR